jgi:DNA-binding ferritin-like protein
MDKTLGMTADYKEAIAKIYATATVMQLICKSAHLNVTGPNFGPDHAFFGELYDYFDGFVDDSGERIRQLGSYVITTFDHLNKNSIIELVDTSGLKAQKLYFLILDNLSEVIKSLRAFLAEINASDDYATVNWLSGVIQDLEKYAWKVASTLDLEEVKEPAESSEEFHSKVNLIPIAA